ncbi:hypothetical protein HMI54_012745 [Coelomomyces lativittatus]|nr:hypothetical protein HMI54_012745 [Coelomomyces lativittatus]KAJ1517894.1 hypothetical protein HMI55_005114 [Coelomomyces lativittatus]
MFSIGDFFLACLLLINAAAILHEERFLARIGWGPQSVYGDYGQHTSTNSSIKLKIISLIHAIRTLLRIPLIIINTLVIIQQLLLG